MRRTIEAKPSATIAANAENAARRAAGFSSARGHGVDQMAGKHRHEQVGHGGAEQAGGNVIAAVTGCLSQWRNTKGNTTRMAAGRLLRKAVMASSGYAQGAHRLRC